MAPSTLSVFAFATSRPFTERIAAHPGIALAAHEERPFEDGEHKTRQMPGRKPRARHRAAALVEVHERIVDVVAAGRAVCVQQRARKVGRTEPLALEREKADLIGRVLRAQPLGELEVMWPSVPTVPSTVRPFERRARQAPAQSRRYGPA